MDIQLEILDHFFRAATQGHLPVLQRLVETFENGEGPRQVPYAALRTTEGYNALHVAAMGGWTDVCRFLMEKLNFDINSTGDEDGDTPLLQAIRFVHERQWPTVVFLIDCGVDVTIPNRFGETPLHFAAMAGSMDIIKILIEKGADVNEISWMGVPLHYAIRAGDRGALECLLDHKADPDPIMPSMDMAPLCLSLVAKDFECMELLLKAGADPNRRCYGTTPLRYAASLLNKRFIRRLLEVGANPNLLDAVGYTPLEYAASIGRRDVVELLFPVTSRVACYPDWSCSGVMHHAQSREATNVSKLKEVALISKTNGDEAFKRKHYLDAHNWYTQAVDINPTTDAKVLANRSLCNAILRNGRLALADAETCVRLEPGWAKAHFREGAAWQLLKDYKMALEAFSRALVLEPGNKEIQKAHREAMAQLNEDSH